MKRTTHVSVEKAAITPEGILRRVLAYGDDIMVVEFTFTAGMTASWHSHPHAQASYIVKGEIDVNMEGFETVRLKAGGSFYVPPNVHHNVVTYEPTVIVDAFTPKRDEFLA